MTCTTTLVLKRYVKPDGSVLWVAYLPSKPVADVGIVSAWTPNPIESLRMMIPACPPLATELIPNTRPSNS